MEHTSHLDRLVFCQISYSYILQHMKIELIKQTVKQQKDCKRNVIDHTHC